MNARTGRRSSSDHRPLYVQVRTEILERIQSGALQPGQALPSEMALARELGVHQGTIRRGLDSLVADQLLVRRQGSGTFVADHTAADVLFRFFKLYTNHGKRVLPTSRDVRVRHGKSNKREASILNLDVGEGVIRISRTRCADSRPFIREAIVVAASKFPDLGASGSVPNTLYDLFQHQYGITVTRADERIETVTASARDAGRLKLEAGAPLLKVDRITFGLGDQPIEWRVSLCHLKGLHYLVELR